MEDSARVSAGPASLANSKSSVSAGAPVLATKRVTARRWLGIGVAFLLIIGGAALWWNTRRAPPAQYTTVRIVRGSIARTVTATGTVNPVLTIIVGTYVSGVIETVYCDYNTRVKQGQICAKIDPRPYQTIVDQDQANLETAQAQLTKDSANLAYATLTYDRNVRMAASGAVTQDAVDESKSTRDQALAQIAVDQATISQRQAELQSARINLDYTNIVSPVNGTVVSRNVTMGQTVAASFQTPTLFLIATDLTQMEVDANISESDIGGVKVNNPSMFSVEAHPNRVFVGAVTQVRQSPLTVQNVVTYDVLVGIGNPDLLLKPGMTATIKIVTAQRADVVRVADQALRFSPGGFAASSAAATTEAASGPHVWVLRDGRPVRVSFTAGLDDDTFTEVIGDALQVGDEVIVSEHSTATKGEGHASAPRVLSP